MTNGLDPDLVLIQKIDPDLGPNCLQKLLADDNFTTYNAKNVRMSFKIIRHHAFEANNGDIRTS